jgi:hypothetical protein
VVDRLVGTVVLGAPLDARPQPDQLGDLRLDDLDPPLQR